MTFVEIPVIAVGAVRHGTALCHFFVHLQHIVNDGMYSMRTSTTSPAKVSNCVVRAGFSSMTHTLHCVASNGTHRRICVAGAHENWIGSVSKMIAAGTGSLLMGSEVISRRCRKTQSLGRHCFARSFKGNHRYAICQCHQATGRTTKRVAHKPDVGIRIYLCDITINLLCSIVVAILVLQCFDHTRCVAAKGRRLAVAYLQPTVSSALATTAGEEEVVVDLVVRCCA
jgi:hypothetical protein